MLGKSLRVTGRTLLWLLCFAAAILSWRFMIWGVDATMDFVAYHAHLRPAAFYAHVIAAPLALVLVPFQLWQGLRMRAPPIHRLLGRIYGVLVLISGVSGLWLAITTEAGAIAGWGFGLLAVLWLLITGQGVALAMRGDYPAHRRWMIRSIALTLAGVMLRLYVPLSDGLGIPFDTAYTAIAWLCWVPNLIVAELIVRRRPALLLSAA